MPSIDRRRFLQGAAGAATAIAVGGPFQGFTAMAANAKGRDRQNTLRAVPDLRDGKVRLWLPEGFQYRSFHDTDRPGDRHLDDGTALPGRHDGMGAFPRAERQRHARPQPRDQRTRSPPPSAPAAPYDTDGRRRDDHRRGHPHGEVVDGPSPASTAPR